MLAMVLGLTGCLSNTDPGSEAGLLANFNRDRAANGAEALTEDPQLTLVAQRWAEHLAAIAQLDHQDLASLIASPDMSGWNALDEDLFVGPTTVTNDDIENAWMASPLHRSNILNPTRNYVGIGHATDSEGHLWVVADFGSR